MFFLKFFLSVIVFFNLWGAPPVSAAETKSQTRFLLMLSSFKRPTLAEAQILRFFSGTYQNFDLSLSLKGVSPETARKTILKTLSPLEKSGRLFIRFDPNRQQLTNLLDTVQNIDLEKYDYFCKIDDDDWYAPTYLETVDAKIQEASQKPLLAATIFTKRLLSKKNGPVFENNVDNLCGPTLCLSRAFLKQLIQMRNSTDYIKKTSRQNEDALIVKIAKSQNGVLFWKMPDPLVVYGQQFSSIMRNKNYRSSDYPEKNIDSSIKMIETE